MTTNQKIIQFVMNQESVTKKELLDAGFKECDISIALSYRVIKSINNQRKHPTVPLFKQIFIKKGNKFSVSTRWLLLKEQQILFSS